MSIYTLTIVRDSHQGGRDECIGISAGYVGDDDCRIYGISPHFFKKAEGQTPSKTTFYPQD